MRMRAALFLWDVNCFGDIGTSVKLGNTEADFKLEQWNPNPRVLPRNVKSAGYQASPRPTKVWFICSYEYNCLKTFHQKKKIFFLQNNCKECM